MNKDEIRAAILGITDLAEGIPTKICKTRMALFTMEVIEDSTTGRAMTVIDMMVHPKTNGRNNLYAMELIWMPCTIITIELLPTAVNILRTGIIKADTLLPLEMRTAEAITYNPISNHGKISLKSRESLFSPSQVSTPYLEQLYIIHLRRVE